MFTHDTFKFLSDLEHHNNREWFEQNKDRYQNGVLFPALDFIEQMHPLLQSFAPHFEAIPKKVGGSLMRIYRDVRFSRDKSPYKTNIGIQFRHELGKDIHAPGFYVHIANDECFLGVGCWQPEANTLGKIRDWIAQSPDKWFSACPQNDSEEWRLWGSKTSRPPHGYATDHRAIEDLKRKDFVLVSSMTSDEVLDAALVDLVAERFKSTVPFMQLLCQATNVQF